MKKRYMVGLFFICMIVFALIFFILWNRHKGDRDGLFAYPEKMIAEKRVNEQNQLILGNDSGVEKTTDAEQGYIEDGNITEESLVEMANIQTGYYLAAENGYVCIYKAEDKSLFYQSDILIEDLPKSLQEEISVGKYIDSEIEVYHFLESYSS